MCQIFFLYLFKLSCFLYLETTNQGRKIVKDNKEDEDEEETTSGQLYTKRSVSLVCKRIARTQFCWQIV